MEVKRHHKKVEFFQFKTCTYCKDTSHSLAGSIAIIKIDMNFHISISLEILKIPLVVVLWYVNNPEKKSNIIQYVDFWLSFLPQKYSHKFCLFTDHGKVLKTINAASADDSSKVSSVVIEELDVLAKPEPIRNLKIVRTMQYGECIDEEWWIIIFSLFCVLYYGALHQHKFF